MRYMLWAVIALAAAGCGSEPAAPAGQAGTAAPPSGEQAFAVCANCHTRQDGQGHRVGPNLHGIVGRKAGSAAGYAYSPAMQASGITWDAASLDAYLANPLQQVPGGRMSYMVPDAATRQALIEYLSAP